MSGQVPVSGISLKGAFGGVDLDGVQRGVPPGGQTIQGTFGAGIGWEYRESRLSVETEINWGGVVEGTRTIAPGVQGRESRRDLIWSYLAGLEKWEPHHIASIHIVGGMSYVKPLVDSATQTFDPVTRTLSDWSSAPSAYTHTWAATVGADFLMAFGHFSVGPTLRWHRYLDDPAPSTVSAPTSAKSIGIATSYRF